MQADLFLSRRSLHAVSVFQRATLTSLVLPTEESNIPPLRPPLAIKRLFGIHCITRHLTIMVFPEVLLGAALS